ncbi:MAG: c-type cytochrome [Gammaproteobacteria bacterium]|nr:MAG: c-type cytochrome [Gammaproteobacteria bacterium]
MKGRGPGSCQHAVSIAVIAALAAAALTGAAAQESAAPAHASAAHGKAISYTCLGCHGIDDYKNAYPMYSVPKLEGQNPEYLAAALHGYRDGDRSHLTMHSQASTLSDKDMDDIAAYFAGKPLAPTGKAQGSVPQAATLCVSCHGQDGVAIAPIYPSLAGQHEDYLVRALEEYRKGGRNNPVMKGFAATLKDEDIHVIARYFSHLKPSLSTESRPYTWLTAR